MRIVFGFLFNLCAHCKALISDENYHQFHPIQLFHRANTHRSRRVRKPAEESSIRTTIQRGRLAVDCRMLLRPPKYYPRRNRTQIAVSQTSTRPETSEPATLEARELSESVAPLFCHPSTRPANRSKWASHSPRSPTSWR